MAIVCYLEGTDPLVLTKLAIEGVDTAPLSNGFDNHGKYINHVTREDGISAVIGYLHKIMPTPDVTVTPRDLLFACLTHEIPVLLIVDKSDHEKARQLLREVADPVRLVDPSDLYQVVLQTVS